MQQPAIYIVPLGYRLGDMAIMLPLISHAISLGSQVYIVPLSPVQRELSDLIEGLAGIVNEDDLANVASNGGGRICNFFAQMDERIRDPNSESYESLTMPERLRLACSDFNIVPSDQLQPLRTEFISDAKSKVLFIPGATSSTKRWPVTHWIELAILFKSKGLDVFMLGQPDLCNDVAALVSEGVRLLETPRLRDAVNAITSALFVVTVDTGFMHLAVNQLRPTISIFNKMTLAWRRDYAHSFTMLGSDCSAECLSAAAEADRNFKNCSTAPLPFQQRQWNGSDYLSCRKPDSVCTGSILPMHVVDLAQRNGLVQ